MPLDPVAYQPYADPDDFIREVTDLIWVQRDIVATSGENYEPDSIVHGALGHVVGPRRGHRGQPDADRGTPAPHRPGRGRDLGGPRRRRVPQLAPGASPATSTSSTAGPQSERTIANCLYRRGRMVEEWVVRDSLADRAAARPGPRRGRARRSAFRGYEGSHDQAGTDRRARRPATAGRGPTTTGPRCEMVLEFIQEVWNDRDLQKVDDFMVRDLVLHTVGNTHGDPPRGLPARACCGMLAPFPAGQFEVRDIADQLRRALRRAADRRAAGCSPATYNGAPTSGRSPTRRWTCSGVSQFLVQDGRIVREVRLYDEIALRAQINGHARRRPDVTDTNIY